MQVLKSLGTVANGWAKFVVTLLAAGWFGVYALNEMRPGTRANHEQSIKLYDEGLLNDSSKRTDSTAPQVAEQSTNTQANAEVEPQESVVRSLGSEVWSAFSLVFGAKNAQLLLAFLTGTGIGLAGRPTLSYVIQKRRIAAARRRLQSLEEDRQLLARAGELSVGSNQPPVSLPVPVPTHEPTQSPKV